MITFYIDRNSKKPIYIQLYQFIKKEIEKGNLKSNEKMPSKRKLAEHLKISQITIEGAYQQLVTEGYLRSVPKSGFYVENYEPLFYQEKQEKVVLTLKKKESFLYDFKTNVVDEKLFPFLTWAKLSKEVLMESNYELLNVSDPQGLYQLRVEIMKYLYNFRGIKTTPEQIVVGSGIESLLSLVVKLVGSDKLYGVENPGYNKIINSFNNNNCRITDISVDEQGLVVSDLIKSNVDVVHITPSHQFPLGVVMPIRRRLELLNWANQQERFILEDDYDSEFRFYTQPIPALQGLDQNQKVIYFNSFSKSLAPSLRISYLVLPLNLLKKYQENVGFFNCMVPNFEQYTLYKFIEGTYYERHINRMRIAYKEKLETFVNSVNKYGLGDIVKFYGHDAGLHFLLEVNNGMKEEELISKAKEKNIRVYGLWEYYYFKKERALSNILVIGYSSLEKENIEKAIKLLAKVWL